MIKFHQFYLIDCQWCCLAMSTTKRTIYKTNRKFGTRGFSPTFRSLIGRHHSIWRQILVVLMKSVNNMLSIAKTINLCQLVNYIDFCRKLNVNTDTASCFRSSKQTGFALKMSMKPRNIYESMKEETYLLKTQQLESYSSVLEKDDN